MNSVGDAKAAGEGPEREDTEEQSGRHLRRARSSFLSSIPDGVRSASVQEPFSLAFGFKAAAVSFLSATDQLHQHHCLRLDRQYLVSQMMMGT